MRRRPARYPSPPGRGGLTQTEHRVDSALVFEVSGQRQAALDALRAAIAGGHPKYQIAHHPDLRALRTDDRYLQLIAGVAWRR